MALEGLVNGEGLKYGKGKEEEECGFLEELRERLENSREKLEKLALREKLELNK